MEHPQRVSHGQRDNRIWRDELAFWHLYGMISRKSSITRCALPRRTTFNGSFPPATLSLLGHSSGTCHPFTSKCPSRFHCFAPQDLGCHFNAGLGLLTIVALKVIGRPNIISTGSASRAGAEVWVGSLVGAAAAACCVQYLATTHGQCSKTGDVIYLLSCFLLFRPPILCVQVSQWLGILHDLLVSSVSVARFSVVTQYLCQSLGFFGRNLLLSLGQLLSFWHLDWCCCPEIFKLLTPDL